LRLNSSSPLISLRCWRLLAAALLALVAAACSTIRIGYNNADWLMIHQLDGYVGLTGAQESFVRERMTVLLEWHRSTQLPDYATFVQHARERLDGQVTAAEVAEFNAALNTRLGALGHRIAPDFAQLALMLSPAQLDRLEQRLLNESREARQESEREAQLAIEARAKKVAKRSEFWLGGLTAQQMQMVRASIAARPTQARYWIDERERRHRDLVALLRRIQAEQPSAAIATEWIRSYFAELNRPSDVQRREQAEAFRSANAELVAQLINHATPKQSAVLDRRLSEFISDFVALAQRGGAG
jgi:hypothetical protein